jgi:predicted extracellular nuclease
MRNKSMQSQWLRRALACAMAATAAPTSADLYFSEYVEGSSYNKALEIFNGTGSTVDLSAYEVAVYFNGSTTAGSTINLQGTLHDGGVHVLSHSSASEEILAVADQTHGSNWFNGDDAVVLMYGGNAVDVIGQIGFDPGSSWTSGDVSTANHTLRRKSGTPGGDADGSNTFDPALEWEVFPQDSFDSLGAHGSGSTDPEPVNVVINEIDSDTSGTDTLEFIELYDGGAGSTPLDGLVVTLYNGSTNESYNTIDLAGYTTNAEGYFVIGNTDVTNIGIVIPSNGVQNGADAVALYQTAAGNLPNGSAVTVDGLVDAVVYGTNDADDAELLPLLNADEPQINEDGQGAKDEHSNQRCPNGQGGLRNTSGYTQATPTPGAANRCGPVVAEGCGSPATKIHAVQGDGALTPIPNTTHSIEGVVVGDFQGGDKLTGFFLQEEDGERDADPLTSEGIFVYDSSNAVAVAEGDVVRVTGTVGENYGMTQISATNVETCASGASVAASEIHLPVNALSDLERFEGMSVAIPQTLTVTENYNLGRYGELVLSANGRLFTATQIANPGAEAQAVTEQQALRRILLDDGSADQNPAAIPYPAPELTAYNTVRSGDTVANLQGVLHYSFDEYRVQPTAEPTFVTENMRSSAPETSATGSFKVASFNVLNYFNGDGTGGGFPTPRGADTQEEFERQRQKIIDALVAMDADVVGLIEIENDGYGPNSAIQDLVDGLSHAGLEYAVVDPGVAQIGTDEIAVGFIYKPATVDLVNAAAILDSSVDSRFIDTKNRPVLAQTFSENATGGTVTVAVAHLKSKGSDCNALNDPDTGDGQGNCNLTREAAAQAMTDWLASDPTQSGEADKLIIGDLNAYAKEDPITAIESAGYVNLIADKVGVDAYSYVFRGLAGYLDHALANSDLYAQVTAVTEWHINADEPRVLDYNVEHKTPEQVVALYSPEAYRASDHDPLVVQLDLTPSAPEPEPTPAAGDFDGDSRFTALDLKLLFRNLGRKTGESNFMFDLDENGRIEIADALVWLRGFLNNLNFNHLK